METTATFKINLEITGTYITLFDEVITSTVIVGEQISGARYEEVIFEGVEFIDCEFQATDFVNVKFIDCTFRNCTFSFVKLDGCNMVACKIENCTFCITNSLNSNFLSCTYINNNWEASSHEGSLINCNIDHTELVCMNITQTIEVSTLSSNMELQVA